MSTFLSSKKKIYRTISEQFTGLFLLVLFTVAILVLAHPFITYTQVNNEPLITWVDISTCQIIFSLVISLNTLCYWLIWRKISLKLLVFETALLSILYSLFLFWHLTFFIWENRLLSFTSLLFTNIVSLMLMALYWKKEKIAVYLLIPSLIWVTYLSWNHYSNFIN